jgi:hypothetical protein
MMDELALVNAELVKRVMEVKELQAEVERLREEVKESNSAWLHCHNQLVAECAEVERLRLENSEQLAQTIEVVLCNRAAEAEIERLRSVKDALDKLLTVLPEIDLEGCFCIECEAYREAIKALAALTPQPDQD